MYARYSWLFQKKNVCKILLKLNIPYCSYHSIVTTKMSSLIISFVTTISIPYCSYHSIVFNTCIWLLFSFENISAIVESVFDSWKLKWHNIRCRSCYLSCINSFYKLQLEKRWRTSFFPFVQNTKATTSCTFPCTWYICIHRTIFN